MDEICLDCCQAGLWIIINFVIPNVARDLLCQVVETADSSAQACARNDNFITVLTRYPLTPPPRQKLAPPSTQTVPEAMGSRHCGHRFPHVQCGAWERTRYWR